MRHPKMSFKSGAGNGPRSGGLSSTRHGDGAARPLCEEVDSHGEASQLVQPHGLPPQLQQILDRGQAFIPLQARERNLGTALLHDDAGNLPLLVPLEVHHHLHA